MDWTAVSQAISAATGTAIAAGRAWPVGGGSINSAFRYDCGEASFFVKLNRSDRCEMFAAEAAGLRLLARADGPRVPAVVTEGEASGRTFLVLEYIPLRSGRAQDYVRLGGAMAALHRTVASEHGWDRDNTIGTTPQHNRRSGDWVEFWREQRLAWQLELAAANGFPHLQREAEPLLQGLTGFFEGYEPQPSLLHGDLWAGNVAFDAEGRPVVFDPACYFGDRETDIAMSELFGGFTPSFYAAYADAWPLHPGYPRRRELYQLYHVLNHLNLFGGGYLGRSEQLLRRLNAALPKQR